MKSRFKNRIGLTIGFSIYIFIINLITTLIVGALMYISLHLGIIKEHKINSAMILPILTLIASLIIGVVVSICSSRIILRNVREFIKATDRLSKGDFNARLNINHPPEFGVFSENFNKMAKELGGIEVLRTDFINNFSHEFKTPIISIKGFAEILKYDDLTKEERDEYLDIIIDESKRLTSLALNVLTLSKLDTQVILQDISKFNIGEQLRQCILILDSKFDKENIELHVNIEDYYIKGNKEMLNQVWLNLLDNAIKFNKENGIITVSMNKDSENVYVDIADSGKGISEEAICKIFDRFYQSDESHSTKGNGIGLAIVDKIIKLHSGTITCKSLVNEGTKFTITLPIE